MPTSAAVNVANAIAESLRAAGIADGRIYHVRPHPSASAAPMSVTIRQVTSAMDRKLGAATDWTASFALRVKVWHGANADRPDEVLGEAAAAVYDHLIVTDPTLGGSVGAVEPAAIAYDFNDPEQAAAVCDIGIRVRYRTSGGM